MVPIIPPHIPHLLHDLPRGARQQRQATGKHLTRNGISRSEDETAQGFLVRISIAGLDPQHICVRVEEEDCAHVGGWQNLSNIAEDMMEQGVELETDIAHEVDEEIEPFGGLMKIAL